MDNIPLKLRQHQHALGQCKRCPDMTGPPVYGEACHSPIMLIGQAPGSREIEQHRPFAWTAGKTLFKWFADIDIEENWFRQHIYMSAICRCYPGKPASQSGGDRVPSAVEIENCSHWLKQELQLLRPRLVIPVGKLAIKHFIRCNTLSDVIGQCHPVNSHNLQFDVIPLPHPSGVSRWPVTEPGKTLLKQAIRLIQQHEAMLSLC